MTPIELEELILKESNQAVKKKLVMMHQEKASAMHKQGGEQDEEFVDVRIEGK